MMIRTKPFTPVRGEHPPAGCPRLPLATRFIAGFVAFCMLAAAPESRAAGYSVPQVQAVFLFNFAQFVKWPPKAYADAGTPLMIGVLGANPFGGELDKVVRNESVGGRRLAVRYSRRVEDLKNCQIVFISKSEAGRIRSILTTLQAVPALTVSDIPGFCEQGGMINFVLEAGRVKFSINTSPARSAGLQISSKLLRLAY
jgi:hypothetical protein